MCEIIEHEYPRDRPFLRLNEDEIIERCIYNRVTDKLDVSLFCKDTFDCTINIIGDALLVRNNPQYYIIIWDDGKVKRITQKEHATKMRKKVINDKTIEYRCLDVEANGVKYSTNIVRVNIIVTGDYFEAKIATTQWFSVDPNTGIIMTLDESGNGDDLYILRVVRVKRSGIERLLDQEVKLPRLETFMLDAKEMTIRMYDSSQYWKVDCCALPK
jgi:hypothetical protein